LPRACFRPDGNLGGPGSPAADYAFDDGLVVTGDRLQFVLAPSLVLDLRRTGTQLAGTLGGWTYSSRTAGLGLYSDFGVAKTGGYISGNDLFLNAGPAPFSGSADNTGRLTATFDGAVRSRNCCEDNFYCVAAGFTWTPTPH
jgi:hypothetical protein